MGLARDREEFAFLMGRETRLLFRDVREIMRLAQTHARLAVLDCNRGLTEYEQVKRTRLELRIEEAVGGEGSVIFSGDPRGATVKVRVLSGRSNSWGGEGICVPAYA